MGVELGLLHEGKSTDQTIPARHRTVSFPLYLLFHCTHFFTLKPSGNYMYHLV
jgi:hypothetical protein